MGLGSAGQRCLGLTWSGCGLGVFLEVREGPEQRHWASRLFDLNHTAPPRASSPGRSLAASLFLLPVTLLLPIFTGHGSPGPALIALRENPSAHSSLLEGAPINKAKLSPAHQRCASRGLLKLVPPKKTAQMPPCIQLVSQNFKAKRFGRIQRRLSSCLVGW